MSEPFSSMNPCDYGDDRALRDAIDKSIMESREQFRESRAVDRMWPDIAKDSPFQRACSTFNGNPWLGSGLEPELGVKEGCNRSQERRAAIFEEQETSPYNPGIKPQVSIPHYMDGAASAPPGGGFVSRAVGGEDLVIQARNYKVLSEIGQLDGVSFEEFLGGEESVAAAKKHYREARWAMITRMSRYDAEREKEKDEERKARLEAQGPSLLNSKPDLSGAVNAYNDGNWIEDEVIYKRKLTRRERLRVLFGGYLTFRALKYSKTGWGEKKFTA